MRFAGFTVDVDRDVNIPQEGKVTAVSREVEGDFAPRFQSSGKGLEILVHMLDDLGIKGTFFIEAETAVKLSSTLDLKDLLRRHEIGSHGLGHEDLTGESTGVSMSPQNIRAAIETGVETLEGVFHRRPVGFRAPYLHVNRHILKIIGESGFSYDSSIVQDIAEGKIQPYQINNRLTEVPLARGKDPKGKRIVSYLWPLHEGRRMTADYRHLLTQLESGYMVLATHSWHMVETYSGALERSDVERNVSNVKSILESALEQGIEFMTIEDYLSAEGRI